VLGKLDAKTFLRIGNPLHRGHWDFELTIANGTGADSRDGAEPLDHSKSALFHVFERSRSSTFHFEKRQCVAPAGCYDQKTLKLVSPKIFSSGVTKIAVRKLAI
jgi:hypothetical protein